MIISVSDSDLAWNHQSRVLAVQQFQLHRYSSAFGSWVLSKGLYQSPLEFADRYIGELLGKGAHTLGKKLQLYPTNLTT